MATINDAYGDLYDYQTGEYLREATRRERDASREAAKSDGGAGVILAEVEGEKVRCYVQE